MIRNVKNASLLVLLIFAVLFTASSCENLKASNLQANWWFQRANANFTENKYRLAIEEYEKALSFNPDLVEAYRFLGESYKNLYKPAVETPQNKEIEAKALEALNKAYEIDPTNKGIIHSLGDMYDKMRNFEEAEKLFLKILEMEPTKMDNYYVVAEFYKRYAGTEEEEGEGESMEKSPFQKAEEMYLRRIEADPENPQGYAYIAQFYENITPVPEFDLGVYYHKKRIELNPEDPEAWLAVGVNRWSKAYRIQASLSRQERIDLANDSEAALKKANELDGEYPEPYSWLSVLYKSVMAKLFPDRAKRYEDEADIYSQRFQELRKREAQRKKLEQDLK